MPINPSAAFPQVGWTSEGELRKTAGKAVSQNLASEEGISMSQERGGGETAVGTEEASSGVNRAALGAQLLLT